MMSAIHWITCLVMLAAYFMCAYSQGNESYSCMTEEECEEEGNFTIATVENVMYCCNYGDSLTTTIYSKDGVFMSSFYVKNTKRDEDETQGKTVNCTCNAVDLAVLNEEIEEEIEQATEDFWRDWDFWSWN